MLDVFPFYEIAAEENIPCPEQWLNWPKGVPLNGDRSRSVDLNALSIIAEAFAKLGYPLLVIFTIGTTIG